MSGFQKKGRSAVFKTINLKCIIMNTLFTIAAAVILLLISLLLRWAYLSDKKDIKKVKEFRESLKVGDETNEGVVVDILGYLVRTEKTTRIEKIYPPPTVQ